MIFLAPIPAILAAAVAVPLLLVLYFLKLRRRPVRVGSTLLWAEATEDMQANVPFRWLRASLLLLLQLLILASLLLAMSRPAIDAQDGMPDRVFILIDRSASMRATDAERGGTRFDAAKDLASEVVRRTTVGSFRGEITVIGFAAQPDIVAGPTRSRGELLEAIDALGPTDQPADLAAALRTTGALAAGDEEEAPPLVVVCSDGATLGPLPPSPGRVVFERPALAEAAGQNVGFVALAARRDARRPALVRLFCRLQSTFPDPATVTVTVRLEDEVIRREVVELSPADESGPGQTPLSLPLELPVGGLVSLTLDRADSLSADDSAAFTIDAPRAPAVVLVRETESEGAGSGWLLTDLLRELRLASLVLVSAERAAAIGDEIYANADLVIFDGVQPASLPPVATVVIGEPPTIEEVAYRPSARGVLPVIAWDREHPLMRDVSLDAVRVGRASVFTITEAGDARFAELLRTAEGPVAIAGSINGSPLVMIGFDLLQSTWPLHYSFPIFWANVLETLPTTIASSIGRAYSTTTPVTLDARNTQEQLRGPPGTSRSRTIQARGEPPTMRLGVLELAGVWTLGTRSIPVNLLDDGESSLISPETLPLAGDGSTGPDSGGSEPREIWPWFVVAAFALLAMEWVLFGSRMRV